MYWRIASITSFSGTLSHSADSMPRNTVFGMGRPSTFSDRPFASIAMMRRSSNVRTLFTRTRPPGLSSAAQLSPSSVSSRYTTKSACSMALRSPIGSFAIFVNARTGAPRRSGPNEGNASA